MVVREIDVQELAGKLHSENIMLLDIRSSAEAAQGVIPESKHMAMHLIPLKLNDLPKDVDIVLYCRSGARSYHACSYLMQQGISNVINLRGGILAWAQSGLEISRSVEVA